MPQDVYVLVTADCETARNDVTAHSLNMSYSGPANYDEGERSIRGYAAIARQYNFPLTLFAHPEVAQHSADMLLDLEATQGACLGLHLHPYKFRDGRYQFDVGAYTAAEQREIFSAAVHDWQAALGRSPIYFRSGYSSGNDMTYGVLLEMGFRGVAIANPGRVLPTHCSVWVGAEFYPHRAHLGFRLLPGTSDLVEVPVSVDEQRPLTLDHAGGAGYEWPYVPAPYSHQEVIQHLLERFKTEKPPIPVIYLDTHNDQDYTDPDHPARQNLVLILDSIVSSCRAMDMRPVGATIETICDLVLAGTQQRKES